MVKVHWVERICGCLRRFQKIRLVHDVFDEDLPGNPWVLDGGRNAAFFQLVIGGANLVA